MLLIIIMSSVTTLCNCNRVSLVSREVTEDDLFPPRLQDNEAQVGNDISNIEVVRWLLKTQFDRNVVTQYDVQEQIFDHVFSHLGIDTEEKVDHPLVLTEPPANPNYCRQMMTELLFECYHVPKVAYGVDALFSFNRNNQGAKAKHGLVLSCGYQTTHVLPIVDGKVDLPRSKRMFVGGSHMTSFMHRLLQLKYPAHFTAVTLSRAEEMIHDHSYLANDYNDTVQLWRDLEYYEKNVHKIQLPYTPLPVNNSSSEALKERRQQQGRRLQEINNKRRNERLAADEEKLQQLKSVQELLEDEEEEEAFARAMEELGYTTPLQLQGAIIELNNRIQHTKEKLLNTKDSDSCQEPKAKRFCEDMESSSPAELDEWLTTIRQKRQKLLESRAQRQQRKADMAKRRTAASQERMKLISLLAANKKKEDNFGVNDDDWQVYKTITREAGETDSEEEQEKMQELESLLREHDPVFEKEEGLQELNFTFNLAEYYQLHLGLERIRVPELLFQPSMMGIDQAGIVDTIEVILKNYSSETQSAIVQNIFLTGGCAQFPGLECRLQSELMAIRPFKSIFNVSSAADPQYDAWIGAREWATNDDNVESFGLTRADYEEKGGEYLKEHHASNSYYQSPASVVVVAAVVPPPPPPVGPSMSTGNGAGPHATTEQQPQTTNASIPTSAS